MVGSTVLEVTSAAKHREGNGAARGLVAIARARGLTVRRLVCADDPRDLAGLELLEAETAAKAATSSETATTAKYNAKTTITTATTTQRSTRGEDDVTTQGFDGVRSEGAALVLDLAAHGAVFPGGAEGEPLPGGGVFSGDVSDKSSACGRLLRRELEALFSTSSVKNRH